MKVLKFCTLAMLAMMVMMSAVGGAFAASFTSEKGGFSIELPEGWESMPKNEMDAMAEGGTYLMAIDQAAMRAGKSVSLSILRMPPYDETLTTQNIAAAQVEAMQEIAGLKDVKTGIRNIGGMDWAVVSYATEFMGTHSSGVNYSFVKDGGVVTTLYFKFDNLSDYESVAEKTVESFKAK